MRRPEHTIQLEGCAAEGAIAYFAGMHFGREGYPDGFAFGRYEPETNEHALWVQGYAACAFLDEQGN